MYGDAILAGHLGFGRALGKPQEVPRLDVKGFRVELNPRSWTHVASIPHPVKVVQGILVGRLRPYETQICRQIKALFHPDLGAITVGGGIDLRPMDLKILLNVRLLSDHVGSGLAEPGSHSMEDNFQPNPKLTGS